MNFTLIHENKLKAALSAEDMRSLGLDFDRMDYSDPVTRKALIFLLENGRNQVGFDPRKSKLFIEVYPCDDGGCVLYFTNLQTPGRGKGAGMEPVLFRFDSAETLLEGAEKVWEQYGHRIFKSSLYRMDGKYRLVVWPLDYADRLSIYFLSEFGEKLGEGELLAAYTGEHGKELIDGNAIEVLSELFPEPEPPEGG